MPDKSATIYERCDRHLTDNPITLGSLFDGIGAVPFAASFFGIKPLWASEILPKAVSVTRRHFPEMAHLGDVAKLDGGSIPPVNIIAFGSPCQSFSIAGDRTGLAGKSGLFMEAIRIIREMRCATHGKYPEIVLFENVVGLLLSAAGLGVIIKLCLKRSQKPKFQCLDLDGGQTREWLEAEELTSLGSSKTQANISECHSEEGACSLSQILQATVPQKYFLSAKACQGILRRARTRGKALPPMLQAALEAQSQC